MAYASFPSFSDWLKQPANGTVTNGVFAIVKLLQSKPDNIRRRALETVRNVAALETGAIEELYPSNRGLTITAATGVAILDAVAHSHGEIARSYVAAALDAYELVLNFSTGKQPVLATWIRELHGEICKNQQTYRAFVADRFEERPLPKGEYKSLPNHVRLPDETTHYYANPEDVTPEMNRLVDEISRGEFVNAHPIEQASYMLTTLWSRFIPLRMQMGE